MRGQGDADGGEGPGGGGLGAGVEVHDRAREAAGHREAATRPAPRLEAPRRDQLLVRVDALAALGGQRLADRDRLDVAHQMISSAAGSSCRASGRSKRRQDQPRQALRNHADDRDAGRSSLQPQTATVVATIASTGPALVRMSAGALRPRPCGVSSGFRPLRTQNRKASDWKRRCSVRQVDGWPGYASSECTIVQGLAVAPECQGRCLSWPAAIRMPEARDEAGDHRMAEEVGEKPQPQQPHGQQHADPESSGEQQWPPPGTPGCPGRRPAARRRRSSGWPPPRGRPPACAEVPKIA